MQVRQPLAPGKRQEAGRDLTQQCRSSAGQREKDAEDRQDSQSKPGARPFVPGGSNGKRPDTAANERKQDPYEPIASGPFRVERSPQRQ